uniref:Uncharacterized protein n=1 Tax=Globisporangium ultimum (strain ATCC 200006 / CBS 805.95 / DAOM BR144) TaxID=431595 RepID=K3WDB9_GLOUD
MLLQHTTSLVANALAQEEARFRDRALVLTEVQAVLDEMVYDVETCAHESEVMMLKRELAAATSALVDHQQRERDLVQERQQAYDYAAQMELRGKQTAAKFQENIAVVLLELAKKEMYTLHKLMR